MPKYMGASGAAINDTKVIIAAQNNTYKPLFLELLDKLDENPLTKRNKAEKTGGIIFKGKLCKSIL